jgi:hypothetical protein
VHADRWDGGAEEEEQPQLRWEREEERTVGRMRKGRRRKRYMVGGCVVRGAWCVVRGGWVK